MNATAESASTIAAAAAAGVGLQPPRPKRRAHFGLALACGVVLALGPLIASWIARPFVSHERVKLFAYGVTLRPSSAHLLGTDGQGRAVLASLVYGITPTLKIGLLAGVIGVIIGTVLGVVAGYMGGFVDAVIRTFSDVMLCIPAFAILVIVAALFGTLSVTWLGIAIALLSWPLPARAIRTQILSLREQSFVVMSKLSNRSGLSIMFLEILPNMLPYVMATFVGLVSFGLLTAIGLELLGLGPIGVVDLGSMIQSALNYGALSQGLWWWWAPPAILLVCLFLGLFFISLTVDRISNPRLAGGRG
jgi:peptide/nickel transport system permease protein